MMSTTIETSGGTAAISLSYGAESGDATGRLATIGKRVARPVQYISATMTMSELDDPTAVMAAMDRSSLAANDTDTVRI